MPLINNNVNKHRPTYADLTYLIFLALCVFCFGVLFGYNLKDCNGFDVLHNPESKTYKNKSNQGITL